MGNKMSKEERRERLRTMWKWAYRLRSVVLAMPVAAAAVIMAIYNLATLPEMVGINLQADGEFAQMVSKGLVVMGPLALTSICLLLTFCSRKVLYPWLISVFSLALPLLFMLTNMFPG